MGLRARPEPSLPPPARWAAVQEALARIAGIALLSFDTRGSEIAAAGVPEICRLLEADPEGASRCAAWCRRNRELAVAENRAVFYRCHAGLRCFVLPLRAQGRAVGAVLGGRALERAGDVDQLADLIGALSLPPEPAERAVGSLPLVSPRLLSAAADLTARAAEALFSCHHEAAAERARTKLLSSLLALGADFAREREPHEVYTMILDAAAVLFDMRSACLLVRDGERGPFRLRSAFGAPVALLPAAGLPEESPLLEPVLRDFAPALTDDRARIAGQGFPPGTASLALFPLVAGERVLGVLCVIDTPAAADLAAQLAAFCHQAALALSNALLREALARRTREVERTQRIRDRLAPLLGWDEVIEAVFQEALQIADAREGSLMLFDRAERTLRVDRAHGPHSAVLRAVSVPAYEGIAGRVLSDGRPLLVEDLERDERLRRPRRPRYRTSSCLVVPLVVRGRAIGVINLADKAADAPFSADDLEAVLEVTAHASWALQRSALHRRMQSLREQAVTDPLTGLANRRYLQTRLREEAGRARRHGAAFTLTMIDLDDFKSYNDREGHPAGDALLAAVARVIRSAARDTDVVARYGGDEFAVISPSSRVEHARKLVERIRQAVATHAFDLPGLPATGGVSLCAGVAGFPADTEVPEALVSAADAALYRAKAAAKGQGARGEA